MPHSYPHSLLLTHVCSPKQAFVCVNVCLGNGCSLYNHPLLHVNKEICYALPVIPQFKNFQSSSKEANIYWLQGLSCATKPHIAITQNQKFTASPFSSPKVYFLFLHDVILIVRNFFTHCSLKHLHSYITWLLIVSL